ncbi:MAG: hypothetical protein ACLTQL_08795 [Eisenbergiella sp.]
MTGESRQYFPKKYLKQPLFFYYIYKNLKSNKKIIKFDHDFESPRQSLAGGGSLAFAGQNPLYLHPVCITIGSGVGVGKDAADGGNDTNERKLYAQLFFLLQFLQ